MAAARLQDLVAGILDGSRQGPAIEFEKRWCDWADVRRLAERVAALIEGSGAAPGAPIVFIARNQPEALAALVGLIRTGRTIRMVYPFQSPARIAADIARLKPGVVIAAKRDCAAEVCRAVGELRAGAIALEDMAAGFIEGFEDARGALADTQAGMEKFEILTSGTTGPPKQFAVSYDLLAKHFAGASSGNFLGVADFSKAPPTLLFMPLGNISGLHTALPNLIRGVPMVLLERFDLGRWHDYVLRYRPSNGGLPPAAVGLVLSADIPPEDLSSIRYVPTGAAPLDPVVHRAFEDRYGIPILMSYGATEFAGPVAMMTPELHAEWGREKFGSVGRAFNGASLRVVDPETREPLPPGEAGLLEVVSPRIGPDWIRTSDLAVLDEDGFLFHRGRADGAIIRGGFKILPETIERALLMHPGIAAAGVVGVPDPRLGEVPGAVVQLKPGVAVDVEELEAHLRGHVLATHIPGHWRVVEELPKTPSFKIDRPGLKRLFPGAPE